MYENNLIYFLIVVLISCNQVSNKQLPIQDVFAQINDRINETLTSKPELNDDIQKLKEEIIK